MQMDTAQTRPAVAGGHRPHDLLWLDPLPAARLPAWCVPGWPVVVRRDRAADGGRVPVGFRGGERAQRHGGWVRPCEVVRALAPEALLRSALPRAPGSVEGPPLQALRALAPWLDEIGLPWGPTGSAGFAIATGAPVLGPDSDLDLLVRAPRRPAQAQVAGLKRLQERAGCRLDIQIDTGRGGFALNEWLADRGRVLLKTARGPVLVADPWLDAPEEE